jgi:hypothetical protein
MDTLRRRREDRYDPGYAMKSLEAQFFAGLLMATTPMFEGIPNSGIDLIPGSTPEFQEALVNFGSVPLQMLEPIRPYEVKRPRRAAVS